MTRPTLIYTLFLVALPAWTQQAPRLTLSVDTIMRGPQLAGFEPTHVRWQPGSQHVYFEWKQPTQKPGDPADTYVVDRDGSHLRKLTPEETRLAPGEGDPSPDGKQVVFERGGDLFLDEGNRVRQLTRTTEAETDPHFLADGRRISFTRGGNLFVLTLESGAVEQATDIRPAAAPKPTGSQAYLKEEQKKLLASVAERAARTEDAAKTRLAAGFPKPLELEASQKVTALSLAPDGRFAAALIETREEARATQLTSFVTESGYAESAPGRSNVGDKQTTTRVALIAVPSGEVKWADAGQKDRALQFALPEWSPDGTRAVLPVRAADNKDRWLLALDRASGATRVLATDHDDAWLDDTFDSALGWLKGGSEVYFVSERTGFYHLYAAAFEGGAVRALTSGKWEVRDVQLARDRSRFFVATSEESPYETQIYSVDAATGRRQRLTTASGHHQAVASPDGTALADIYSYPNRPPELYVQAAREKADARKVTSSPASEFWTYPWMDPPIEEIPARDGARIPARVFKPASYAPGGPVAIFVHGAGYLQDVDRKWSYYYREYMFAHLLMERGYLVIDLDYRGSAGYGREWRAAVYRHMGGKDLDDVVDAARWAVSAHGAGARRIGLWGGSYGGFLTLMAMFTQADTFSAGAALRPVTDWAYYNHGYTSNILNQPQADAEAYRLSSPIYFAEGLKGALLLCHGMVDDNVEFQDSVRLVQRLIELRKENWELAVYPVESHSFVEATSWADEYKRILKLFDQNLK